MLLLFLALNYYNLVDKNVKRSQSNENCTNHSTTRNAYILFCSSAVLDPRVGHTMDVLSPFISVFCYSDSSTESPVHVLMLSIQAVRGLPRLRAPGIVPCIILHY